MLKCTQTVGAELEFKPKAGLPAIGPLCVEVDVVSVWLTDVVPPVWGAGVMDDSRVGAGGGLGSLLGHPAWTLLHAAPVLSVNVVLSCCLKFVPSSLPCCLHHHWRGLSTPLCSVAWVMGLSQERQSFCHHLICGLVIEACLCKGHS